MCINDTQRSDHQIVPPRAPPRDYELVSIKYDHSFVYTLSFKMLAAALPGVESHIRDEGDGDNRVRVLRITDIVDPMRAMLALASIIEDPDTNRRLIKNHNMCASLLQKVAVLVDGKGGPVYDTLLRSLQEFVALEMQRQLNLQGHDNHIERMSLLVKQRGLQQASSPVARSFLSLPDFDSDTKRWIRPRYNTICERLELPSNTDIVVIQAILIDALARCVIELMIS